MQKDDELIARCCSMVEKSLQWGDSRHWANQDFEALSEKILAKTHVNLSVSTLKRIWGKVKYDSTPTLATLNALARYLDFESWRDFQVKFGKESSEEPGAAADISEPATEPAPPRKQKYAIVMMTSIVVLVLATVIILVKGTTTDYSGAQFNARKTSDGIPNSVIFDYDASGFDADSVFVQQNWDPGRREPVAVNGKQHTSIYFRPGYFQAKLIINNDVAKEDTVFIKTTGWRGIVDGKPVPAYLRESEMILEGVMGITSDVMREKTSLDVFNDVWVQFYNVRDFRVPGNAFDFQTTLRNTSLISESVCRRIKITLFMKGSAVVVPLVPTGCVSVAELRTPNGIMEGKTNDLSAFGYEVGEFQTVRVKNERGKFSVTIGDRIVYEEQVKYPLGDVVGIRIGFEGAGEIAQVRLASGEKVAVNDDFRVLNRQLSSASTGLTPSDMKKSRNVDQNRKPLDSIF